MIEVYRIVMRVAQENTYVLVNGDREALIVDPGSEGEALVDWLNDQKLKPLAVLLTHTHCDHILGLDILRDAFNIEAYSHEIEQDYVSDPQLNLSSLLGMPEVRMRPVEHVWEKMGRQRLASFEFDVAHTPGHSPGHVIYSFPEENFAIVGDTLFQGSIGRTDFPNGDYGTLMESIQSEILTLPEDTILYPGHGPETTGAIELAHNPFLK